MIEHGGNVALAAERYGIEPARWLDLSTGISPFAYPVPPLEPQAWRRLPSVSPEFVEAATRYYGSRAFLALPGSQAAIQLLPRLIEARSVAIAHPTYGEHARCWKGALVPEEAIGDADADVIVLGNPNNPTGRMHDAEALLRRQQARGGWLVVDEAFIDTRPELSLAPLAGEPGLVVLRSVGKFFGLAGARIGFLFGPQELLERARDALGPWPVCGPALAVAADALADSPFHASAKVQLRAASERLRHLLAQRFRVGGATDFFAWVPHPDARGIQARLARVAILVRAFDDPPGLRFGLPGREEEWQRLEDALASL